MKDRRNLHAKMQEYIDCYLEADPQVELREITRKGVEGDATGDMTELALKYLALAVIHGVEEHAKVIGVVHEGDMDGSVVMKTAEEVQLPDPPTGLAREMAEVIRCIAGMEAAEGQGSISCGFRQDRLELEVEGEQEASREKVLLRIPSMKAGR